MKPLETPAKLPTSLPAPVPHDTHECPLSGLTAGCRGRVLAVAGEPDSRRRLLEMGFCNGTMVEMVRRAPFGDPIEYRLRGYCLSLRERQACCITVAVDGD